MADPSARAERAKQLLNDPLMVEAFGNVRDMAIRAWESTKADDAQSREVAWLTVKVIARIQNELQTIIDNGAIAASRVQAPLR